MKYYIRYVHKVSPSERDAKSGVEIPDRAFTSRKELGRALREAGVMMAGSNVRTFQARGNAIVVFPRMPGMTTYWHAIIVEPETRSS